MHERVNRTKFFFPLMNELTIRNIHSAPRHWWLCIYEQWLHVNCILCIATVATQFIEACPLSHTHITHALNSWMTSSAGHQDDWHTVQFVLILFCNLHLQSILQYETSKKVGDNVVDFTVYDTSGNEKYTALAEEHMQSTVAFCCSFCCVPFLLLLIC